MLPSFSTVYPIPLPPRIGFLIFFVRACLLVLEPSVLRQLRTDPFRVFLSTHSVENRLTCVIRSVGNEVSLASAPTHLAPRRREIQTLTWVTNEHLAPSPVPSPPRPPDRQIAWVLPSLDPLDLSARWLLDVVIQVNVNETRFALICAGKVLFKG